MVHVEGGQSAATLGGWGFGVSAFSKHKDEAWLFAEFVASEEGQKTMHFKNGAIPTRHALFKDEEILAESPYYEDLYKVLLTARPRPVHPKYSQISDILQAHVSAAIVGTKEPETALREAAEEIRALLKE
jgi:multiple sugar transport system substrate-binding protein